MSATLKGYTRSPNEAENLQIVVRAVVICLSGEIGIENPRNIYPFLVIPSRPSDHQYLVNGMG